MKISKILSNNKLIYNFVKINIFLIVNFFRTTHKILGISPDNQIVVINFHKLGDSVFTIPALKEINKFFKMDFYIFCFEETKPIFELFFKKSRIITFKHSDFFLGGRVSKNIIREQIIKINPEIIFDLTGGTTTATLLINSRAKEIIGINEKYYKPIYTKYVPIRKKPHVIDIYLDAIRPVIPVTDDSVKKFRVEVKKDGYILIHPFAGWGAKEWNFTKFLDLSEKINNNFRSVIISDYGKINSELKDEIKYRNIELIETKDIYEFIKVAMNCSLFVSNDSGPVHIANMLGKPTFIIFGPTNPIFHIPHSERQRFIQKFIKCSPSSEEKSCFTDAGRNGCPSFECMISLKVNQIYNMLEQFINELGIKKNK